MTYSEDVVVGYVIGADEEDVYETYNEAYNYCSGRYNYMGDETRQKCLDDIQSQVSINAGDKMLWRVVRINGDGSVRLISDNIVGKSAFNSTYYGSHKYVGYTYDNSAAGVQDGTSSTIKTYLDNWYTTNISNKGLDTLIATSTYCNDTSISSTSGSTNYYGAFNRINNNNPQLTCNVTNQTYGGKYALKVGLLSADELMMAGYRRANSGANSASQKTYIWNPNWFWTGSPHDSSIYATTVFDGYYDGSIGGHYPPNNAGGVRPVINLKADILFSSGNGTKDSPYVIK